MTNKQAKEIASLLEKINIYISAEGIIELDSFQEIGDYLEETDSFNIEIVTFSRAMEYLSENDSSLQASLKLAYEIGYNVNELTSEILASLLASEKTRQEFENLKDEIEAILEA